MTSLKACVGVDLGSGSVKVAELKREKDAVRIAKFGSRALAPSMGSSVEDRAEASAEAVRDILRENKITTKQAVFSVPGQAVFVKRVRLPRTTEERLHRIINYEARQQIPFPLDKTMLEFQIFDEPGDPQVEVLLVAIKRDFVETFMQTVQRCKLTPVQISVNSLALFNFHLFQSAAADLLGLTEEEDKGKRAKSGGGFLSLKRKRGAEAEAPVSEESESPPPDDEDFDLGGTDTVDLGGDDDDFDLGDLDLGLEDVKAFLHIGASALDIVIARLGKRRRLGFTRSVPIAGNDITKAVQGHLGIGSFTDAEEVKRTKTAVISEDDEIERVAPGADADASEAATNLVNRLVAEVRRTLDFYVSQPDGVTVDSIVLTGGSAALPNLGPYLEEKVGMLVEPFDEAVGEHLVSESSPPEGWGVYLPALGLGLAGLGLGKIGIDFLPTNLKDIRQFKSKGIEIGMLAACLVASVGFAMQMGAPHRNWYDGEVERIQEELVEILPQVQSARTAISERETISGQFDALSNLLPWREYWPTLYRDVINQWKPPSVFLTRLDMQADGQIRIRGRSYNRNAIADYAANIDSYGSDYILTGEDPLTEQPRVKVYTDATTIGADGQPQTVFEIYMEALTRTVSETVPVEDLARPDPQSRLQTGASRGPASIMDQLPGQRPGRRGQQQRGAPTQANPYNVR